jgi:hypothetical protein
MMRSRIHVIRDAPERCLNDGWGTDADDAASRGAEFTRGTGDAGRSRAGRTSSRVATL